MEADRSDEVADDQSERGANLSDVAALAGVSLSVASRALSGTPKARIKQETRQRILDAARALDYAPDYRARALRSRRSSAIALVVPDVGNSVFSELFAGVDKSARAHGMTVLLGQLGTGDEPSLDMLVEPGRVDGVVLQRHEDMPDNDLASLLSTHVPIVLFNSSMSGREGSVILDDEEAARLAVTHLLELGHRRIAFVGGTHVHDAARRRLNGYRVSMHAAGADVDADWVVEAGWEADAGRSGLRQVMRASRRPTAVVVASVNAGIGAMSAAFATGLRVPEDIAMVTIQDTWVARSVVPALTTVQMPLREAGHVAASMLIERLNGTPLSDVVITDPPPRLIVRGSSAPNAQFADAVEDDSTVSPSPLPQ